MHGRGRGEKEIRKAIFVVQDKTCKSKILFVKRVSNSPECGQKAVYFLNREKRWDLFWSLSLSSLLDVACSQCFVCKGNTAEFSKSLFHTYHRVNQGDQNSFGHPEALSPDNLTKRSWAAAVFITANVISSSDLSSRPMRAAIWNRYTTQFLSAAVLN